DALCDAIGASGKSVFCLTVFPCSHYLEPHPGRFYRIISFMRVDLSDRSFVLQTARAASFTLCHFSCISIICCFAGGSTDTAATDDWTKSGDCIDCLSPVQSAQLGKVCRQRPMVASACHGADVIRFSCWLMASPKLSTTCGVTL